MHRNRFILSALLLLPWPFTAAAQQAVIPPLVVMDGQGDIIGPVSGFLTMNQPVVRLLDPQLGVPVFLAVLDSDTLLGPVATTYFSGADCTGTPYHQANLGDVLNGLSDLTGYAYSVAEYEGTIHLIRSERAVAGTTTDYDSVFSGDSCSNANQSQFLKPALDVMDLEQAYPPAYTAQ